MGSRLNSRPLTLQVTVTVLALALLTVLMVVGIGAIATIRADESALLRQKAFVENGLRDAVAEMLREQESVTVWDDSVNFAKAHDQQWMSENLGEWMYSYYGHDRVYVLDERDRPVYAMEDGKTVPPERYAEAAPVIASKVAELRALMKAATASDGGDTPKSVVEDKVSLAGIPSILSVMPIVPSSNRVSQEPGSEYVHVLGKFIDDGVVGEIAGQYFLSDAHVISLLAAPTAASVPLMDSKGLILGYVGWTPDRPGMALVRQTGPVFLGGAIFAAGVLWFLLRRLRRASTALQTSQDQAQFLAFHDTLTGLPNRALFEDRLRRAFTSAKRNRGRVALLYIDLDRFKNVNDTLGHPAGDELVRQTARRLEGQARDVDTVARLGGDEFAIIMVDVKNVAAAENRSEKVLEALTRPFTLMGHQVFIGASIGIAVALESDADPDDLLRKADIALYEAKRNGRGRHQVFAGDMDEIILRRRVIESDLREALKTGEGLCLVYQPIFAEDCRTMLGVEALVRWDHPAHGSLSPAHFVSIAEERGMSDLLGRWALSSAVRFAKSAGLPWVAVNVSPLQLRNEGFTEELLELLATVGLPTDRLLIEITEGALLEEGSEKVLSSLRAAGIRIALDDFGTGYSSIGYLRRHAVDKLKIDRSFVRQLGASDEATAIVQAIISLARALKLPVTVEGVETAMQRDIVVSMGCSEIQGFLLSRPLDEAQMRAMMTEISAPVLLSGAG